jgi:hypothetical protein
MQESSMLRAHLSDQERPAIDGQRSLRVVGRIEDCGNTRSW